MATVTVISTLIASATSNAPAATSTGDRATPQAGVLEGASPVAFDPKNPIQLFMVQAALIIVFCRLLYFPLRYLGQPRVIAEVIGGIILGPSVMGHIPHFKDAIFPAPSMPVLNNAANLGLIIFLFLTALEVDLHMFKRNWKVAVSVGFLGMVLSFALGVAIAVGLYNHFNNEDGVSPIGFGTFSLFVGTALAITAFPVLCRILTELELLSTSVGVTVLAAGVGNDVVGWILLALCVALVNNANGLAALWALLCCVGWILVLVFAVKPAFHWFLRRNGSLQNGPTQGTIGLTILLVFVSAWFTGIIGVHPIFGGFLVGLICPRESGFAIKLTEKIEDFVSVVFLPLYFALSGLNTNLGLLNDGLVWAYVVGVTAVAFFGKIVGGTLAAKFNGLVWRESFTIGVLMSCKGLVELIVLNIGLQANILSQRTFTLFVVMAVVTTVTTTPLTKLLYPKSYQYKLEKWKRGEIDWDGNPLTPSTSQQDSVEKLNESQIRRLLVYLRLDSLPSLFTFISLVGQASEIQPVSTPEEQAQQGQASQPPQRPLEVHGLRILELTERTSSVMQVSQVEEYSRRDPIVNTFKTFSQLNNLAAAGQVVVAPSDSYAETLTRQASEVASDFALIPWSEIGSVTEDSTVPAAVSEQDRFNSRTHLDFMQKCLAHAVCNTGIFINNGFGGQVKPDRPSLHRSVSAMSIHSIRAQPASLPVADKTHHIFFPFFGGVDDRVALRFVLRLAKNTNVNATICRFDLSGEEVDITHPPEVAVAGSSAASPRDAGSKVATRTDIDNVKTVEEATAHDLGLFSSLKNSLPEELSPRVTFMEVTTHGKSALADVIAEAKQVVGKSSRNAGDLVIVGRRHASFGDSAATDFRGTVGTVGEWVATSGVKASVLVIQAGGRGLES